MAFQDVLGQLPLLKSYTHILFCFSLSDSDRDTVIAALQSATQHLLAAFPFLGGQVVHKQVRAGHSGYFTIEDWEIERKILHIRDLSDTLPSYAALCAARAPSYMLPGSLLAPPRPAFPLTYPQDGLAPVLEIQASLIQGGLLLDLAAQHNIIDATGIFHMAGLLARLMDSPPGDIQKPEIQLGNCDRRNLIPLLPDQEPLPDSLSVLKPERFPPQLDTDTLAQFKWYWLHFSPEAIVHICREANSHPEDFIDPITSVSVNDALTAFCWQRIALIRFQTSSGPDNDEEEEEKTSQLTRATDLRRAMNLSPAYMGHMVRTANLRLPVSLITRSSLSNLASRLRVCVQEHTTPYAVRAYASLIARETDKSRIAYAGSFDPRTDFSCSSVAHIKLPFFGGLGKPEFMRRPTFGPLPGGMYIGPGWGGVGLDAVVCLLGTEMELLKKDECWNSLVETIE
ncbi:hypothetical protein P175DRAFT_0434688 [Aspergillus ochraceoroseus IBT 24754]|uniref:Trichothecene 3-O-acetyltransferase-like N-terminal domain-containing protein n=1 Tax=Aspergillus ochraceoroseus IBT 24754 TaxID=1392256 RepID=A0A2T5M0L2_9EURO|nr:uncharacterized protein P175DRAFT_0434688 [Aspergillus ochraceoroseus IBT 24754]PTU22072.1 hypothetical protein P175DRAFT_0434688 [Aspergillus ochraceoroseus IBT 24754]